MVIKVPFFYFKKLKIFQNLCFGSKITSFVFSRGVKGLYIKTTKKFFRKLKLIEITSKILKITNFWHFLKKYINIFLKQVIFGTIFNILYCFRTHFEHNQFCLQLTYPALLVSVHLNFLGKVNLNSKPYFYTKII